MTSCILVDDTKRIFKARYVLAFLGFLGLANVYAMRVNLSVAIVAMVNTTVSNTTDVITDVCPDYHVNTTEPTVSTETTLPMKFFRTFLLKCVLINSYAYS